MNFQFFQYFPYVNYPGKSSLDNIVVDLER